MKSTRVIIVGAGHNGLVCAFYLARAGLQVQVVERSNRIGGCCVTMDIDAERAPGCRVSAASYIASMLRPEIIREMELPRHGLAMVPLEPGVQAVLADGDVVTWWNDPGRMRQELERIAPGEAASFFALHDRLKKLARYLQPFFLEGPPDIHARGIAGLRELLRVGKRFWGISGTEMAALVELLNGSLGDFLDRHFQSPRLKSLMLANSLYGSHGGPYRPGTAIGLLFHLLSGGDAGQQGFAGHVIGGMGSITQAMAAACRELGVQIRTGAQVERIDVAHGVTSGVTLVSGERLAADLVVSNADPKATFLSMLDAKHLAADFVGAVRAIRMAGPCAKVNFALSEEPRVNGMPETADALQRALFTLVPSAEAAHRCYESARRGELADNLWVDCVVPSLVDDTLAPAGQHILTCFVQYVPYTLSDGSTWDQRREAFGDQVLATIAKYAPNVASAVLARQVLTPLDLERTFGITEGNIFHGDINLGQLFFMRPTPACAQYATPVSGLYLCGAGTHPGGGVTGAPGYNAARRVLRDQRL